jgi:hypothetical protein
MADRKRPFHEIKFGAIRASIWVNENRDGTCWFALTFGRLQKDEQDQWRVKHNFKFHHLNELIRAVAAAHAWMVENVEEPENVQFLGESVYSDEVQPSTDAQEVD